MSPCLHLAEAFLTEIHPLVCQSKSHIPMGTPNPSPFPYVQVTSNDPWLGWSSQNVRRFWASKSKSSSLVSIFQDFPVSNHQNLTCPIFNGIKPPKYIKVHQSTSSTLSIPIYPYLIPPLSKSPNVNFPGLWSQQYDLASELTARFASFDPTLEFLQQLDQLVMLIESPIFSRLRCRASKRQVMVGFHRDFTIFHQEMEMKTNANEG